MSDEPRKFSPYFSLSRVIVADVPDRRPTIAKLENRNDGVTSELERSVTIRQREKIDALKIQVEQLTKELSEASQDRDHYQTRTEDLTKRLKEFEARLIRRSELGQEAMVKIIEMLPLMADKLGYQEGSVPSEILPLLSDLTPYNQERPVRPETFAEAMNVSLKPSASPRRQKHSHLFEGDIEILHSIRRKPRIVPAYAALRLMVKGFAKLNHKGELKATNEGRKHLRSVEKRLKKEGDKLGFMKLPMKPGKVRTRDGTRSYVAGDTIDNAQPVKVGPNGRAMLIVNGNPVEASEGYEKTYFTPPNGGGGGSQSRPRFATSAVEHTGPMTPPRKSGVMKKRIAEYNGDPPPDRVAPPPPSPPPITND